MPAKKKRTIRRNAPRKKLYSHIETRTAPYDYGVFVWRSDGRYFRTEAIKIFKSEKLAQNFADKNYGKNYVVRPLVRESKANPKQKARAPHPVRAISAKRKGKRNPSYKVEAKVPANIRPITYEVKVPTRTLAVLATRGYVQEMGGGNPNAYTYKSTKLGLGKWRVEATPKVKSSSGTVKALTAGSAVRKFKKTLAGRGRFKTPRGAYEISVQRNPKRKRRNPPATGFAAAGKIQRKLDELMRQPMTMRRSAAIYRLEKALEKAYAAAVAAERKKDAEIYSAPRTFSTTKRKGGGVRKKKAANPRKRKPARKNGLIGSIKKTVKKVFKKKNDGSVDREEFAGKVTGFKTLYFPPGTPQGLSTLGPLVYIETTKARIKPVKGAAYLCQDSNHNLYVGSTTENASAYTGSEGLKNKDLGKVQRVEYTCRKPHLGQQYSGNIRWYHDFESPLPTLRTDGDGRFIFDGGGYTIKKEGITG